MRSGGDRGPHPRSADPGHPERERIALPELSTRAINQTVQGAPAAHAERYILGAEVWSPRLFGAGRTRRTARSRSLSVASVAPARTVTTTLVCVRPRPAEAAC